MKTNNKKTSTLQNVESVVSFSVVILGLITTIFLGIINMIYDENEKLDDFCHICSLIVSTITILYIVYSIRKNKRAKRELQNAQDIASAATSSRITFFSNITHEFRTPIHIMQGMNEMIIRESNSRDIVEYAKNSATAARTLEHLINKLIIYSRIESGTVESLKVHFSISDTLNELAASTKNRCQRKNLIFESRISPSIPTTVIGDEILLYQLLYNLLSNAVEYTDKGIIKFIVGWEPIDQHRGLVIIHIDDTGRGLSQENIDYLCNSDSSSVNQYSLEGSGFGLSIIKNIINSINGTMTIKSELGKGSDFYITIPYSWAYSSDTDKLVSEQQNNRISYVAPNARILIVDDNSMNNKVTELLLKRSQVQIDTATSGVEALEMIQHNYYNLMFFDYMMPGMNGIELLNHVKTMFPDIYQTVPIFALSAATDVNIRETLVASGFKGYLSKPIDGNHLEFIVLTNIPKDLIMEFSAGEPEQSITPEQINDFKTLLYSYDIFISDGLNYMSGDLLQYVNVCKLILKNYDKSLQTIKDLYASGDIKNLEIFVHALKGNAKFIGAKALYNIAMSIETKASKHDVVFIGYALPLLYYQWEKTITGISYFLKKFDKLGISTDNEDGTIIIEGADYISDLMEYTDNFQPEPAIRLIRQVLKQDLPQDKKNMLKTASQYLEDLEYDEAMNIFKEMKI